MKFFAPSTTIDSYCDRYTRICMTLMFGLSSLSMLIEYFTNRIHCTDVTGWNDLQPSYIEPLCWSKGLFLYEEAMTRYQISTSYSYGIPSNPAHNGLHLYQDYCNTNQAKQSYPNNNCLPMSRVYFKQYIWLPFYIGILTLLFYFPYTVFQIVNPDLYSLLSTISTHNNDNNAYAIIRNYFDYAINPISRLRLRVWLNIMVKLIYMIVNIFAFTFTSYLFDGDFENYGKDFHRFDGSSRQVHPGKLGGS